MSLDVTYKNCPICGEEFYETASSLDWHIFDDCKVEQFSISHEEKVAFTPDGIFLIEFSNHNDYPELDRLEIIPKDEMEGIVTRSIEKANEWIAELKEVLQIGGEK